MSMSGQVSIDRAGVSQAKRMFSPCHRTLSKVAFFVQQKLRQRVCEHVKPV